MFRSVVLRSNLGRLAAAQTTSGIHTSAVLNAAANSKKKGGKQPDIKRKAQKPKGSIKSFYEHVSAKKFRSKAPGLFDLKPITNEALLSLAGGNKVANSITEEGKRLNLDLSDEHQSGYNKIFKYDDEASRKLSYLGAFKTGQFNELFSENASLIRKETLEVVKKLEANLDKDSSKNKYVLLGEAGIGKSTMLAQLQTYLINSKAVILSFANPTELINGGYEFSYNAHTKLYEQPLFLRSFMIKVAKANKDVLSSIPLSETYSYNTIKLNKATNSLYDLLTSGVSLKIPKSLYPSVFRNFIHELQNQKTFPVYVTVDDFNALSEKPASAYLNTEAQPIPVEDFQVSRFILDVAADNFKFAKGGLILSTSSVFKVNHTLMVPLGLAENDPFLEAKDFRESFANFLNKGKSINVVNVDKLSKEDVKELVQFYVDNELIIKQDKEFNSDAEEAVSSADFNDTKLEDQKYFLSGNGNPRELIKSVNLLY